MPARRTRAGRRRRGAQDGAADRRRRRVRRCAYRTVTRAYVALGSNLGDRRAHLQRAVDSLTAMRDVRVVAISHVYETAPVGGPAQDDYYNAVVALDVGFDARQL